MSLSVDTSVVVNKSNSNNLGHALNRDATGKVYICGKETKGRYLNQESLCGKKIKLICAGYGHILVLIDAWALQWCTDQVRTYE